MTVDEAYKRLIKQSEKHKKIHRIELDYSNTTEETLSAYNKFINSLKFELEIFEYCCNEDKKFNNEKIKKDLKDFHKNIELYKIEETYSNNIKESTTIKAKFVGALQGIIDNIKFDY